MSTLGARLLARGSEASLGRHPGSRHLAVLKDYGANSIVASICARNVTDPALPDFGYRPAAQAVLERLNETITAAASGSAGP